MAFALITNHSDNVIRQLPLFWLRYAYLQQYMQPQVAKVLAVKDPGSPIAIASLLAAFNTLPISFPVVRDGAKLLSSPLELMPYAGLLIALVETSLEWKDSKEHRIKWGKAYGACID
jgi:hypothetical protein